MRLAFSQLSPLRYEQRALGTFSGIQHDLLLQRRSSGEIEMAIILTVKAGAEDLLEAAHEAGAGTSPISASSKGVMLDRVSKGWSAWPGDARLEPPVRVVVFTATLDGEADEATVHLPTMGEQQVVDLAGADRLPVEEVSDDLSLTYGVVDGVIFARIVYYTDGVSWPPPFHVDTLGELTGAQFDSAEGRVEAALASWSSPEEFLSFALEFPEA